MRRRSKRQSVSSRESGSATVRARFVPITAFGGHSAQVKIQLLIDGGSVPVAQMGPDFLLIDAPIDHPPGEASLLLRVDQSERRWDIRLPNGMSAGSSRVAIAAKI